LVGFGGRAALSWRVGDEVVRLRASELWMNLRVGDKVISDELGLVMGKRERCTYTKLVFCSCLDGWMGVWAGYSTLFSLAVYGLLSCYGC
jgi:hypothetical protein